MPKFKYNGKEFKNIKELLEYLGVPKLPGKSWGATLLKYAKDNPDLVDEIAISVD